MPTRSISVLNATIASILTVAVAKDTIGKRSVVDFFCRRSRISVLLSTVVLAAWVTHRDRLDDLAGWRPRLWPGEGLRQACARVQRL